MTENKRLLVGRKKVEDRFTIILDYDDEIGVKEDYSGDVIVLKHNDLNAQQFVAQLVIFLNDQNQAIDDLHNGWEYWSDKASKRITLLEKENEQLKLRNKQYSMMVNANSDLNDEIYEQLQKTEKALKRVCEENEQLKNKCGNYKQALLDLGINVNILDGTGVNE